MIKTHIAAHEAVKSEIQVVDLGSVLVCIYTLA